MFKQRVYDKFNKVSRNGKVIGKRTIAGRVVKESYGSAKQQHTFTVEVLWSKGVKPLPSLYPLLVKGRNLYRYRTFRQRWANEADRSKVLEEKHRRGATARHVRASTKARVNSGSKRKRSLTDSKQHQIKRQKKPSEASTSGRNQPKSFNNAKAHTKYSNNKIRASSSSAKHSKKLKTMTSSYTNAREVDQYALRPSSPNIFDNSHPDLHQRNKFAAPQVSRERFLIQPYSAYASQFDHRGHLSHYYPNSISPFDSRSSGHFFAPDFYDQRYAASQFQRSNRPWPL
ncbi:Zinc finger CCCH domain-containing protein 62 [Dendrobium catenatum]|uniref:Zinc finger CCCH domain-containing protein 62 n=2 Tax=Dendrobium catenatum TaxID=906689 RepID=A0A2I0X0Q4_9ASPA|nr:Zinc finger CCCH domain-containing protein 62 [Dendrobium catenatum]